VPLILVVEDFLDARELYAEYLTYAGFKVVTAINGHDAVRQAEFFRPDLILMDIRMPGMDGMEATADLKASPALAGIPIVAITADPSPELAARAVEAGCETCLAKPILPEVLVASISRVLKLKS
jgi:two-component system, cell cycle response regulator DivK